MSYDSKTNTIWLGPDDDVLMDIGVKVVNTLAKLVGDPAASVEMKNDWRIIVAWLGSAEYPLSRESNQRISNAWRAYYAAGIAPSLALQSTFDKFSKDYRSTEQACLSDKPPKDLTGVFDRLLASDDEIKEKKLFERMLAYHDIKSGDIEDQLTEMRQLLQGSSARSGISWWRRWSRTFLRWDIVSRVLGAASVFCMMVFVIFAWWFLTSSV